MPAIHHSGRAFSYAIPLAAAAADDRVYLVVGAFDEARNFTYFLLSGGRFVYASTARVALVSVSAAAAAIIAAAPRLC